MLRHPRVGQLLAALLAGALPVVLAPAVLSPAAATSPALAARAVALDPSDRASMRQSYRDVLRPALQTPLGWDGGLGACRAGSPSKAAQKATLTAVNWFRAAVGVTPVRFTSALSAKAQKAALIMSRNRALSHTPPASWACRTTAGAKAAGRSNLYLGRSGAAAVAGYMDDPGSGNLAAGHRRWILDPRQTRMGSGSVAVPGGLWQQEANALYVLHTASFASPPSGTPKYLPWPAAGYMPVQVEPEGRWSLSATKASTDFSRATVKVNGSSSGVVVRDVANGYGPNTLVWDFDPDFDRGDADRDYDVTVSGIRRGSTTTSYSYTVTLFDADAVG